MKNCTWLGFLHPRFKRKKKKRQKPKAINLAYFLILTTSIRVGFFVLNSLNLFSLLFVCFTSFIPSSNVAVQKNTALGLRPPRAAFNLPFAPGERSRWAEGGSQRVISDASLPFLTLWSLQPCARSPCCSWTFYPAPWGTPPGSSGRLWAPHRWPDPQNRGLSSWNESNSSGHPALGWGRGGCSPAVSGPGLSSLQTLYKFACKRKVCVTINAAGKLRGCLGLLFLLLAQAPACRKPLRAAQRARPAVPRGSPGLG